MQQRRHRRRRYHRNQQQQQTRLRRLVSLAVLLICVIWAGSRALSWLGFGHTIHQAAVILDIEDQGIINVSVEGGPLKRADEQLKLYPGDAVVSSPRNYGSLTFFDGTTARLDESTHVVIEKSYRGEETSAIELQLSEGTLWLATPTRQTYSGAIARTVTSDFLRLEVPTSSEAVVTNRSLAVFAADGLGLTVYIAGNSEPVIIGEGQQLTVPETGALSTDLYSYRTPLDPQQLLLPFVEDSRNQYENQPATTQPSQPPVPSIEPNDDIVLQINSPTEDQLVETSTITVNGRIGSNVDKVRINGYLAPVVNGSFSQELALPDEDEVNITIEAVDEGGVVLAEVLRTVVRNREPPKPPSVVSPVTTGEVYRTNQTELEIAGSAPEGAVGILVNDYRLQLFKPGDTDWSYLANVKFDNFQPGENVYEVVAINRGGYRSPPAVITIVLGEGEDGVVSEDGDTDGDKPTPPLSEAEAKLPNNAPLEPGSLTVYSPMPGDEFTATEKEFLIEGNVPPGTSSVWVNGYQLQLFEPSKNFFNYIASVELNTLKRGRNVYRIVARNNDDQIIDVLEYVVTFRPR